jgi:putative phosphoesterase
VRRVALIADIHGNGVALEAVLADVDRRSADEIICLGDVAAGGPQPREVLARLRALGCAVVRGNADDWLLGDKPADADGEGRRLRAIVEWARAQLTDADLAYMESFVPTVERELGRSRRLLCFHGSPRASSDRLLATTPEDELACLFADGAADVFAGGHTHVQLVRRLGASLLVNPGSVGLPLCGAGDGDPSAAADPRMPHYADYAVIEAEAAALAIELRRVPVDIDAIERVGHVSGMPYPDSWAAGLERRVAGRNAAATDNVRR